MSAPSLGEPLAHVLRSGAVESLHAGHLVVLDAAGAVAFQRGDPDTPIWVRSAVKPLQALPLWLSGAQAAFGLSDEALAVAMASHSGTSAHRQAVGEILQKADVPATALQCGRHVPYDEAVAAALIRAGDDPDVLHCNCSGKHAGMLAVCRHLGWPLDTYRDPEHPLQRWIRELVAEASGVPGPAVGVGVDGCGAPVWRLPLRGLARAWAALANPAGARADLADALAAARDAFARHPGLIAGPGRLDTDLGLACGGQLVAKIGGEAVHAGSWLGGGPAWALKVSDGGRRAIGPALARALELSGRPLPVEPRLADHLCPPVRNNRGEQVGEVVPAF